MKRALFGMLLGALVLVLGLVTLALCCENRARGIALDALSREIEGLSVTNARDRAVVQGHVPGGAAARPAGGRN